MSDTFNIPEFKRKITELHLKGTNDTGYEPEPWTPPHDPNERVSTAAQSLLNRHVFLYKTLAIAELVDVPSNEVLPPEVTSAPIIKPILRLPEGRSEFIPKYYPAHHHYPHDQKLLNGMIYRFASLADPPTDSAATIQHLLDAINKYAYGTGSFSGQISRLADMMDIRMGRRGKHKPRGPITMGLSREDFALILEKTLHIRPAPPDSAPLESLPEDYINYPEGVDMLPTMKRRTKAGLPYVSLTKGETVGEALVLSGALLTQLSAALKKGTTQALHDLYKDNWYLSCGLLFPKNERYEKAKWTTKTRNIWLAPFPTHLLLSMISDPLVTGPTMNACTHETPSLQKFSPAHGNLNTILSKATRPGHQDFIYADNWYVSFQHEHHHSWYSLDLEKGEANATPSFASCLGYYLLTRGWTDDDGHPGFNATWAAFATQLGPAMITDSYCLLMNMLIRFPGQGSGNSWTFLINHAVTTLLRHFWQKSGRPEPGTPGFDSICGMVGVNIKIEASIPNLEEELARVRNGTANNGYLQEHNTDIPPPHSQPAARIDLLGWSAAWSHALGIYVPVLDHDRLYSSAAYAKGAENKRISEDPILNRVYDIVRYEALRAVGGWSVPLLDMTCRDYAQDRRDALTKRGIDINTVAPNWKEMSEFLQSLAGDEETTIDLRHTTTHESLMALNQGGVLPHPAPPPASRAIDLMTLNLRGAQAQLKAEPTVPISFPLALLASTQPLQDLLERWERARRELEANPNDWQALSELDEAVMKEGTAEAESSALEQLIAIRDSLTTEYSPPKRPREKVAATIANPVVGYHVPAAKPAPRGLLASLTETGTTGALVRPPRSRNARRMQRRREGAKLREETVRQLGSLLEQELLEPEDEGELT